MATPGSDRPIAPAPATSAREILRLAVPAFGALVAQPLFTLIDAAIVATLGTTSLAALGAGAQVFTTVTGLAIFLAYGTTAVVARRVGAGQVAAGISDGIEGVALGLALGIAATAGTWVLAPQLLAGSAPHRPPRPRRWPTCARSASRSRSPWRPWPRSASCAACRTRPRPCGSRSPRWARTSPWRPTWCWSPDGGSRDRRGPRSSPRHSRPALFLWELARRARRHGASLRPSRSGVLVAARGRSRCSGAQWPCARCSSWPSWWPRASGTPSSPPTT